MGRVLYSVFKSLSRLFFLVLVEEKKKVEKSEKRTGQDTPPEPSSTYINTKPIFLVDFAFPFCLSKTIYKFSHTLQSKC